MSERRRGKPVPIADAIASFLGERGLDTRLSQAGVVQAWPTLVGPRIAAVTQALSVTADGVLFVAVRTHAWMHELTLMETELLAELNRDESRTPVRRIHWRLMR
jgi:predicted nucleic acid-binding Zn ribbon protein